MDRSSFGKIQYSKFQSNTALEEEELSQSVFKISGRSKITSINRQCMNFQLLLFKILLTL